jgi:hypothetical protein
LIGRTPANSSRNLHLRTLSFSALSSPTLSVQPLSFQPLTHCPSQRPLLNPFAINPLRTLLISTEGIHPSAALFPRQRSPRVPIPLLPISFIFNLVRTPLHFLALPKNSTLLFSSDSALCLKKHNHRAWEGIHQRIAVFFEIQSGQSGQLSPLTARQSRVTSHQSIPLAALPFARGCRSARIRMETHDT